MTQRHRLNRGVDPQANRALHLAVIGRIRLDPKTQAYVAKKTGEGHSKTGSDPVPETLSGSRDLLPPQPGTTDHHPEYQTAQKSGLTLRRASRDFNTSTGPGGN